MRAGLRQLLTLMILGLVGMPLLLTVFIGMLALRPAAPVAARPSVSSLAHSSTINNQTELQLNFSHEASGSAQLSTLSYQVSAKKTATATIKVSADSPITECTLEVVGPSYDQTFNQLAAADSSACNLIVPDLNTGNYQFKVAAAKLGGGTAKTSGSFTVF